MVSWGPGVHCRLPTSEQWAGSKSGICQVNHWPHWANVDNLLLVRKSHQTGFESSLLVIAGAKVDATESHQVCTQHDSPGHTCPLGTTSPPTEPHRHPGRCVVLVQAWKLLLKLLGKYLVGTALKTRVCETAEPRCWPLTTGRYVYPGELRTVPCRRA